MIKVSMIKANKPYLEGSVERDFEKYDWTTGQREVPSPHGSLSSSNLNKSIFTKRKE